MRIRHHSLALLPLLLVLSGCTAAPATPEVADLPPASSPAATGPQSASSQSAYTDSTAADRPQLRLDDSDARVAALVDTWRQCLLDHGAKRASGDGLAATASEHTVGILIEQPVPAHATASCIHLEPLQPRELRAATNPHFHEQSQEWIACMRARGLWYTLVNDRDLTATWTPGHAQPDDPAAIEDACRTRVFGGAR